MAKSSFVLLIALILGASTPSSSDLIDDAHAQHTELVNIVNGKVAEASSQVSDMAADVGTNAQTVYNTGRETISMIREQIVVIVNQIKDEALSSGVDITPCTAGHEQTIDSLPDPANQDLAQCINGRTDAATEVISAAVGRANEVVNRVSEFGIAIDACNGNILCVAPIVENIETAKIEIPQQIDSEVLQLRDLLEGIKVTIKDCSDSIIFDYNNKISAELQEVVACLDQSVFRKEI